MKKNFSQNSKTAAGKGFYLALVLSVAAVGTVAYLTIDRLTDSLTAAPEGSSSQNIEWSLPENVEDVNKPQQGVPKAETPSSALPQQEIRPQQQDTAAENSGKAEEKPALPEKETLFFSDKEDKKEEQTKVFGYMMPLEGEIIGSYSGGELVKSKTLGEWRTHDGVDIRADEGTPVKSVGDGTVIDIREDRQWGVVVEIEYPDFTAIYAGMTGEVQVAKDSKVAAGDVIGYVGNSTVVEAAEESHLHFGIKAKGEWADPMSWLKAQKED